MGNDFAFPRNRFRLFSRGDMETKGHFLETGLETGLGNEGVFFGPLVSGLGGFRFSFIHEASRPILPAAFFNQFLFLKSCCRFANGAFVCAKFFGNISGACETVLDELKNLSVEGKFLAAD